MAMAHGMMTIRGAMTTFATQPTVPCVHVPLRRRRQRIRRMLRDALRDVPSTIQDPTTREIQALMAIVKQELGKCPSKNDKKK